MDLREMTCEDRTWMNLAQDCVVLCGIGSVKHVGSAANGLLNYYFLVSV
jgi:hypothetical protein